MKYYSSLFLSLALLMGASAKAAQVTTYDQTNGFKIWQKDLGSCGTNGSGVRSEVLHSIRIHVCARSFNDHPEVELANGKRTTGEVANDVAVDFYPMYKQCVVPNYKAACQDLVNDSNSEEADGPSVHQKYHHKNISVDLDAPKVGFDDLFNDDSYQPDNNCEARMILKCLNIMTQRHANAVANKGGRDSHWRIAPLFDDADKEFVGQVPARGAKLSGIAPAGFSPIKDNGGLPPFIKPAAQ